MSTKNTYQQEAKARLNQCQKAFELVEAHTTAENQQYVKALFNKQQDAHQHLRALEQANDDTWSLHKQKLEHTFEQLHQDFQRTLDRIPHLTEQVSLLGWTHDSEGWVEGQGQAAPPSEGWVEGQGHPAPSSDGWIEGQGHSTLDSDGWLKAKPLSR